MAGFFVMAVEQINTINPYRNGPDLLTSSRTRHMLARQASIATLGFNHPLHSMVGRGEDRTQNQTAVEHRQPSPVLLPLMRSKKSPPLPMELAIDKAQEAGLLALALPPEQRPERIASIDSVYVIGQEPANPMDFNHGQMVVQKPKTNHDVETLVGEFVHGAETGSSIASLSGIAVANIKNGQITYDTYMLRIGLGRLSKGMDANGLYSRMRSNGHNAAGLTTDEILGGDLGLVEADEFLPITIFKFGEGNTTKFVGGSYLKNGIARIELSNTPENIAIAKMVGSGLLPQR